MAAESGSRHLWGGGQVLDDSPGAWAWVRAHRVYCTAVVAIVAATLSGAHWAGQPPGEVSTTSSLPSVTLEAPSAGG